MCGFVFKNDLKVVLVTMKRQNSSENDQEGYKEPRLAEESGSLNRSVRTILRRSIELRQAEQSEESASKSEDNSKLRHWAALLSNAGFSCELRPIVESDLWTPKTCWGKIELPCWIHWTWEHRKWPVRHLRHGEERHRPGTDLEIFSYVSENFELETPIMRLGKKPKILL